MRVNEAEISWKELREWLRYDSKTGEFYWLQRPAQKIQIGDKAGYVSKHTGFCIIKFKGVPLFRHRLAVFYMTGRWANKVTMYNKTPGDDRFCNLVFKVNGLTFEDELAQQQESDAALISDMGDNQP